MTNFQTLFNAYKFPLAGLFVVLLALNVLYPTPSVVDSSLLITGLVAGSFWVSPLFLLGLLAYPASVYRTYQASRSRGMRKGDAALYAVACLASKLPQVVGQVQYLGSRFRAHRKS